MKSHALNTCVNTSVNKKVAIDLCVHSRAIENRIVRTIRLHLRNRKWIARVAPYLDTRSPRCADSDALEIQNTPNRATCALDPPAAIQLRAGTQSHALGITPPAMRDCRRGARLSYHPALQRASHETCPRDQTIRPPPTRAGADESQDIPRMCGSP